MDCYTSRKAFRIVKSAVHLPCRLGAFRKAHCTLFTCGVGKMGNKCTTFSGFGLRRPVTSHSVGLPLNGRVVLVGGKSGGRL